MIDLSDVFWVAVLALGVWYWFRARGAKDMAYKAAKSYCKGIDIEFLDESVVLRGFWFKRDSKGMVRTWRSYFFEFSSTGDDRYKGKIILLGNKVESIQLDIHRLN